MSAVTILVWVGIVLVALLACAVLCALALGGTLVYAATREVRAAFKGSDTVDDPDPIPGTLLDNVYPFREPTDRP